MIQLNEGYFILDCVVEDAGDYEITAVNPSNTAKSPVEIVVYDKPSAPTGPVKFDSVSADSVHLSWEPPAFVGGSPISSYIVEKREATSMVGITTRAHILTQFQNFRAFIGTALQQLLVFGY